MNCPSTSLPEVNTDKCINLFLIYSSIMNIWGFPGSTSGKTKSTY